MDYAKLAPIIQQYLYLDPIEPINATYLGLELINASAIDPDQFDLEQEIKNIDAYLKQHTTEQGQKLDTNPDKYKDQILLYGSHNIDEQQYGYFTNQDTFIVTNSISETLGIFQPRYCFSKNVTNELFHKILILGYYFTWLINARANTFNNAAINKLAKLIYYQNKQSHHDNLLKNSKDTEITESEFIKTLEKAINKDTRYNSSISIWNLCLLIYRLRNNINLDVNQAGWLLNQNRIDNDFVSDFLANMNLEKYVQPAVPTNKNIDNKNIQALITNISNYDQVNSLKVYPIQKQHLVNNEPNTFYGIHGTEAQSIPTILTEGLKDAQTLANENHDHYETSGAGLGNGIYFARLNQFQKALNYSVSSTNTSYALVCQVNYNQIKHTDHYANIQVNQNEDLIWAHAVGGHDRDEIVAKHPGQVKILYLLEIHYKTR